MPVVQVCLTAALNHNSEPNMTLNVKDETTFYLFHYSLSRSIHPGLESERFVKNGKYIHSDQFDKLIKYHRGFAFIY